MTTYMMYNTHRYIWHLGLKNLKIKNCEGHDQIPQRKLYDGIDQFINPLGTLFDKIYYQKCISNQWHIAKVTPLFKKSQSIKLLNINQFQT